MHKQRHSTYLSKEKNGHHGRRLVVLGKLGQDLFDLGVVLLGEVERGRRVVILRVLVLCTQGDRARPG